MLSCPISCVLYQALPGAAPLRTWLNPLTSLISAKIVADETPPAWEYPTTHPREYPLIGETGVDRSHDAVDMLGRVVHVARIGRIRGAELAGHPVVLVAELARLAEREVREVPAPRRVGHSVRRPAGERGRLRYKQGTSRQYDCGENARQHLYSSKSPRNRCLAVHSDS